MDNYSSVVKGTYGKYRGAVNLMTLLVAMVLSIMVIHSQRICEKGKGYPSSHPFLTASFAISIIVLILCCVMIVVDMFPVIMKFIGK